MSRLQIVNKWRQRREIVAVITPVVDSDTISLNTSDVKLVSCIGQRAANACLIHGVIGLAGSGLEGIVMRDA